MVGTQQHAWNRPPCPMLSPHPSYPTAPYHTLPPPTPLSPSAVQVELTALPELELLCAGELDIRGDVGAQGGAVCSQHRVEGRWVGGWVGEAAGGGEDRPE